MTLNTPPPYANIGGISRADMKDNRLEPFTSYNGNARPGELVVDLSTYTLYVGNALGYLNPVGASGNGTVGGANTNIQFNDGGNFGGSAALTFDKGTNRTSITLANITTLTAAQVTGNLNPSANVTYSLGNTTNRWKDLWLANSTLYLGDTPLSAAANTLQFNGANVVTANASGAVSMPNISVTGNIVGNIFIGNGSGLSGVVAVSATTSDTVTTAAQPNITSVGVLTAVNSSGTISATGNVIGGNVSTVGNVTGAYVLGNGAFLTGLPASYGNANVAAYLPVYSGNLTANNVSLGNLSVGGNTLGEYYAEFTDSGVSLGQTSAQSITITGSGIQIAGTGGVHIMGAAGATVELGGGSSGNIIASNNLNLSTASASGNVTAAYFIGDGSALTNLPAGNYSNSNVAAYLPTYTGAVTADTVTANVYYVTGSIAPSFPPASPAPYLTGFDTVSAISILGNIIGDANTYLHGDGSNITGISGGNYSNSNVAAYLPTNSANITGAQIGNAATFLYGDGSNISGITASTGAIGFNLGTIYEINGGDITIAPDQTTNASLILPGSAGDPITLFNNYADGTSNIVALIGTSSNYVVVDGQANITANNVFTSQTISSDALYLIANDNILAINADGTMELPISATNDSVIQSLVSIQLVSNGISTTYDTGGNWTMPGSITAGNIGNSASFLYGDGGNITGITAGVAPFIIEDTDFTAVAGAKYGVNTTLGPVTATLPSTPNQGDAVFFSDSASMFATNALTVDSGLNTIMGVASPMTVNTNNQNFGLYWSGATWRLY